MDRRAWWATAHGVSRARHDYMSEYARTPLLTGTFRKGFGCSLVCCHVQIWEEAPPPEELALPTPSPRLVRNTRSPGIGPRAAVGTEWVMTR